MTNIRPKSFEACIRQIKRSLPGLIVSAYELGVARGERDLDARDFDIFVLARLRSDIPRIVTTIHSIARQTLHTPRPNLAGVLEDAVLAPDEYAGIHVLAIGSDELGPDYSPRSLRLRALVLLTGLSLPLYYFRQRARLLFGRRLPQRTPPPPRTPSTQRKTMRHRTLQHSRKRHSAGLQERRFARLYARWGACFLPMIAALSVPLVRMSTNEFRMWCFKIARYQGDLILTYLRAASGNRALSLQDILLDHGPLTLAAVYRNRPTDYYGSRTGLYVLTWRFLAGNLRLLWHSRRYLPAPVPQLSPQAHSREHVPSQLQPYATASVRSSRSAAGSSTPTVPTASHTAPMPAISQTSTATTPPEPPATSSSE